MWLLFGKQGEINQLQLTVTFVQDHVTAFFNFQQMLVDTPDYADRCEHLEKLKNRLEALLSPQLMAAFNAQSIGISFAKILTHSKKNTLTRSCCLSCLTLVSGQS